MLQRVFRATNIDAPIERVGAVSRPAAVEDATAAGAGLLKGITADYLLRGLGHVRAGTRLLVHAAAGSVGLLLCAWA